MVKELLSGNDIPFPLDTTMTVGTLNDEGHLFLHSPIPLSQPLLAEVKSLGQVTHIIAPNLQHWLFVEEWFDAFPNAQIYTCQPALNEDVRQKLPQAMNVALLKVIIHVINFLYK